MKYHITHKTWYAYDDLVPVCHNLVHLAPRATPHQKCLSYRLKIEPTPTFFTHRNDYFGNRAESFSIEGPHRRLEITAESTVDVTPPKRLDESNTSTWEECVLAATAPTSNGSPNGMIDPVLWQLSYPSPRVPALVPLREYAEASFSPRRPILEALADLTARIHRDFKFDTKATTVETSLVDVLRVGRGVCQDFAHLATGCLRSLGLVARYTSGYLRTTPPPGKPRLVGADASHAWCSSWCGQLGWIDFDPTNNCFVGDSHVAVAWGRDYGDVCPIQGVFVGGGDHQIGVSVEVAPEAAA
jgi:transglutaminase-like putative cysteine protease